MRTTKNSASCVSNAPIVGMKPLSERDENFLLWLLRNISSLSVGMKPLSERDENQIEISCLSAPERPVGMKPLSERDENYSNY